MIIHKLSYKQLIKFELPPPPIEIMSLPSCSIGETEESDCHSIAHTHGKTRLIPITEYSPEDTDLIVWRTGIRKNNLKTICLHHQKLYLEKFASCNHCCANPFGHHDENKKIKGKKEIIINKFYNVLI